MELNKNGVEKKKQLPIIVRVLALLLAAAAVVSLCFAFLFGKIETNGLVLESREVLPGGAATLDVTVTNSNPFPADGRIPVKVDGRAVPGTPAVHLDKGNTQTVKIVLSGYPVGVHTVKSGTLDVEFKVLQPATFVISDLGVSPDPAIAGEDVTFSATVTNLGEVAGTYSARMVAFGEELKTDSLDLNPGESRQVSFITKAEETSEPFAVGDASRKFTVWKPADFDLKALTVSPGQIKPTEEATLTATIVNSGDAPGTYTWRVITTKDGKDFYVREVAIQGHSSETVTCPASGLEPGHYTFWSGGHGADLDVYTISRPENGTLFKGGASSDEQSNSLTIENNYGEDVLVVLAHTKDLLMTESTQFDSDFVVYVRAKSQFTIHNIEEYGSGIYYVFYSIGTDFSEETMKFMTSPEFARFDDSFNAPTFSEYHTYTITLNPSGEGNAPVTIIDLNGFPK